MSRALVSAPTLTDIEVAAELAVRVTDEVLPARRFYETNADSEDLAALRSACLGAVLARLLGAPYECDGKYL